MRLMSIVRYTHPPYEKAFIRVATPAQAARISEAFPADAADGDKVRCEIVSGTREVIYWMALPEKIRMGAVHRERGSM